MNFNCIGQIVCFLVVVDKHSSESPLKRSWLHPIWRFSSHIVIDSPFWGGKGDVCSPRIEKNNAPVNWIWKQTEGSGFGLFDGVNLSLNSHAQTKPLVWIFNYFDINLNKVERGTELITGLVTSLTWISSSAITAIIYPGIVIRNLLRSLIYCNFRHLLEFRYSP